MTPEAIGIIVAALLTLAGVIYAGRNRPETSMATLAGVVNAQGAEIARLDKKNQALEKKVEELSVKLSALEDVAEERARWQAVAELLTRQLQANGMTPVVGLPEKKKGTGPLGKG